MYTRSYSDDRGTPQIPSGYDGIALRQESLDLSPDNGLECNECTAPASEDAEPVSVPLLNRLSGLFGIHMQEKFHIGFEEILIGAVAIYLFLSRDGDKECAIMLALLLIFT